MTLPSRIAGALAKLPPAHTFEVSVERDLVAKMPDGAELLADRWYPTNVGRRAAADRAAALALRAPRSSGSSGGCSPSGAIRS